MVVTVCRGCRLAAGFVLILAALPALADPPSWAPRRGAPPPPPPAAPAPYGISQGVCDRTAIGAVLGAAAGGLVGSQVGGANSQTATTIGGVIVGAFVGGVIGQSMDRTDQACAGQALEYTPDKRTVVWQGPQKQGYWVTPTRSYASGAQRYCRDYKSNAVIAGRGHATSGTACRSNDGSWRVVKK